jgi:hypothetical protein
VVVVVVEVVEVIMVARTKIKQKKIEKKKAPAYRVIPSMGISRYFKM